MTQDLGSDLEDCTDDEKDNELLVVEVKKRRKVEQLTVSEASAERAVVLRESIMKAWL